jgi:hypothetical protein
MVELTMPVYQPAIAPARLFLLAGAAVGLVNLAAIGAIAAGRQRHLPLYASAALALNVGLSAAALFAGAGLEGVAAASLAGHLLFAAAVLRLNVRVSGIPESGRFVFRMLRPMIWCALAVEVAIRLGASGGLPAPAALGIYLPLLLPLAPEWRRTWRRVRA